MADALIAARMGSSRFKGKTLTPVMGVPMLGRMVERIRQSASIDRIVLATTDLPEDDGLEAWSKDQGLLCYRGSSEDVLGRLHGAAKAFKMNTIVEMLGDNPLVHSDMIDAAVEKFDSDDCDYVATLTNEYPHAAEELKRFPIGVRVQVFSFDTLQRCADMTSEDRHREHATSFIGERPDVFKTGFVEAKGAFSTMNKPAYTFAVNFAQNLDLISKIFEVCYPKDKNFTVQAAIEAFEGHPDWVAFMGEPKENSKI